MDPTVKYMSVLSTFKNLLIETLKDNKRLIIALYILFIIVFIASWVLSADLVADSLDNVVASEDTIDEGIDPITIFVNNERGGIITYVSSVLFGIPAIVMLMYNAFNLGTMGQMFSIAVQNGGLIYIIYLIPHGIFEITATVIESAAGILLFMFIWNFVKAMISKETHGFSDSFEKTKNLLIQSLILMIFSAILLLIAAPIESFVSVPFSQMAVDFLT